MTTIAIFDLDKTLLPIDSDHGWGGFLVERGYVDADYYQKMNDYFYGQYTLGTLNINDYAAFSFKVLVDNDAQTLASWHDEYMQTVITPALRPQALALVKKHLDAGHLCVLSSATSDFIVEPIGKVLGFEHVIATKVKRVDGRYTDQIDGTPNFKDGKISRVDAFLAERDLSLESLTASFFYSDSINDLPLLERVTFPTVVHPDARLTQIALERHWPSLSLFAAEYAPLN